MAQALEVGVDEGVFLQAGDGEQVNAAGGRGEAGEFPVAGVRAGADAAASGMGRDIGAEAPDGRFQAVEPGQGARARPAHVDHFREVEGGVAQGVPGDAADLPRGQGLAEDLADAADGFAPPPAEDGEGEMREPPGEGQRQAVRQAGDQPADGSQEDVFDDMLGAVLHRLPPDVSGVRGGTRRASRRSVRAAGIQRAASSARAAAGVTR